MFSRDSCRPDDPEFAHQLAAGIIARAQAKLCIASDSCNSGRALIESAKSAVKFCSQLETVSSLLQSPVSSIDPDLRPTVARIQSRLAKLQTKRFSDKKIPHQTGNKVSFCSKDTNIKANNSTKFMSEIEMKRVAMSEMTKIPVKILEKRLHGLGDRLVERLNPQPTTSPMQESSAEQLSCSNYRRPHLLPKVAVSPPGSSPTSPKRQHAVASSDLYSTNKKWRDGGAGTCAVAVLAVVYCHRIRRLWLLSRARRSIISHAANTIQRAFLTHMYHHRFHGSACRRAAFFKLVKYLRRYVRRWRFCKRVSGIHHIRRFLFSIKLRAKFVGAIKQKVDMVHPFTLFALHQFLLTIFFHTVSDFFTAPTTFTILTNYCLIE
jgi:anti-sigma-K factor RskA